MHAEDTLVQVAHWMRGFHHAVADFVPPAGAVWRMGAQWALFLAEHGWTGPASAFLTVVAARIQAHVTSLRDLTTHDPVFSRIVTQGGADALEAALAELAQFP